MSNSGLIVAIREVAKWRRSPGQRLTDVLYGPMSRNLRARVVGILTGKRCPTTSKEAQWGNFLRLLYAEMGVEGECIANREADFERRAGVLLGEVPFSVSP